MKWVHLGVAVLKMGGPKLTVVHLVLRFEDQFNC